MSNHHPRTSFFGILALFILGGVAAWGIQQLVSTHNAEAGTPNAGLINTSNGYAIIHDAVLKNDTALVNAAIKAGADVNAVGSDDSSSARAGMSPLAQACFEGSPEIVKALVDAKAKLETRSSDGRTPLMFAAGWGDSFKVKMLLDAGARVDSRSNDGWTALMFAAARGDVSSVKLLVEAGADVNASNKWRQTALMAAARTGSVEKVQKLLDSGADPKATDANGDTALTLAATNDVPAALFDVLVKAGTPIDAADRDGVTALMRAADRADAAHIQALLTLGASKAVKDKINNWTAKDWAAKRDDEQGKAAAKLLE
jgi:ankyrin repeat protein